MWKKSIVQNEVKGEEQGYKTVGGTRV